MKKRILHIVGDMDLGGAETMLMNLYRNIDRNRFQFDFLEYGSKKYYYDDEIISLGGTIHRLKDVGNFLKRVKEHYSFFKDHTEYEAYHIHMSGATGILAAITMIASKLKIKKIIVHSHTTQLPGEHITKKMILKHNIFKIIINHYATDYIACSRQASDFMFSAKITDKQTFFLYNPIDIDKFDFNIYKRKELRSKFKFDESAFIIGHVGRFDRVKNHDFLIDIFQEISIQKQNTKLILCGNGVLMEDIKRKVEKLKRVEDVFFVGCRSDINDILQMCDCFIFPSLFEGLGISAIESQVSGLPTFVSDKVPNEVDITPGVLHISLKKSAKEWADIVLENSKKVRISCKELFLNSAYDVKHSIKELIKIYGE